MHIHSKKPYNKRTSGEVILSDVKPKNADIRRTHENEAAIAQPLSAGAAGTASSDGANNQVNDGAISENFKGIGPVSHGMVRVRAAELALINGRSAGDVLPGDMEAAKHELAGESDSDRKDDLLDSLPESKRWDPVPGSEGHETPGAESEDMDDEGRSETEQLVDQGSEEAEHDRMLEAARETEKTDLEPK
jgi:hypothetical protein